MRKLLSFIILASLLLAPITASAATAGEIIKKSIRESIMRNLESQGLKFDLGPESPQGMNVTIRVEGTEKFVKKGKANNTFYGEFAISSEEYPLAEGGRDVGFKFEVPVIRFNAEGEKKNYVRPIAFEVKNFNNHVVYFRLTDLSQEIKDLAVGLGVDVEPLMNTWIKVDIDETLHKFQIEEGLGQTNLQTELAQRFFDWYLATEKKLGSPLTIIRSQKPVTLKTDAADRGQTVSVKFNARWYNAISAFALSEYKHFNPDATKREVDAMKKEIASAIKDTRAVIDRLQTQITVNLTTGSLFGFSTQYSKTETEYEYGGKYVKNKYVSTKKIKGYMTVKVGLFGKVWFPRQESLEIPSNSISPEEALKLIEPKENFTNLPYEESASSSEDHAGH